MTRRRIVAATVIVALTSLAGLTGCAGAAAPASSAAQKWNATTVAGLPVANGPSGMRPGAPEATLPVDNTDGGQIDQLAVDAISDVQLFWKTEFPAEFGATYPPVSRLVSYDSGGPAQSVCGQSTAGVVNAFYCQNGDSVAWDRGQLLPMLNRSFGPMSVVTVFAHEFGHAVQVRLGPASHIDASTSSIVREQQADCYAGGFIRWVAEGHAPHFVLSTGAGLNQILSTLFFIRDPTGTSFATEGAHGDAFDRVTAFQLGFGDGVKRCAQIDQAEIDQRITEQAPSENDQQFGTNQSNQAIQSNLSINDEVALRELNRTLQSAFALAKPPTFTASPQNCDDVERKSPAAFCPASDSIALDLPELVRIGTPPSVDGRQAGIGDFAAFAEVASRYALAVQAAVGAPLTGAVAAQRTACLTGVWAGTIRTGKSTDLELSPGDLDEAVAEMLASDSLIAADGSGASIPSGFTRVQAFREGFSAASAQTCMDAIK
jgi:predicted metalloprotease